tara:strand:- start:206 stop:403 length:198 start_codon:yes stop_codon:yes gene_type:complete
MAKITTENLIWKFFEKWKEKRLNKFAKQVIKDNPDLVKTLKKMDDDYNELIKKIKKQPKVDLSDI